MFHWYQAHTFPMPFKLTWVTPLCKKPSLAPTQLENYLSRLTRSITESYCPYSQTWASYVDKSHSSLESCITWRSFSVSWLGHTSAPHHLATGEPRGSVLGPLFAMYSRLHQRHIPRCARSSTHMAPHIPAMQMMSSSINNSYLTTAWSQHKSQNVSLTYSIK